MKILIAGGTGYLGGYIIKEIETRTYELRALVRHRDKLKMKGISLTDMFEAEITNPESIKGCCNGCDAVVSTAGITGQKERK